MTDAPSVVVQPSGSGQSVMVSQQPHGNGRGGGITTIASGVLDALRTSPVLLLIVLLNMAFCGMGGYYLLQVEAYRAQDRAALSGLLSRCLTEAVPVDYLLRIQGGTK